MERVLKEGVEKPYKGVSSKILIIEGESVQVTFKKVNGIINISDDWVIP